MASTLSRLSWVISSSPMRTLKVSSRKATRRKIPMESMMPFLVRTSWSVIWLMPLVLANSSRTYSRIWSFTAADSIIFFSNYLEMYCMYNELTSPDEWRLTNGDGLFRRLLRQPDPVDFSGRGFGQFLAQVDDFRNHVFRNPGRAVLLQLNSF